MHISAAEMESIMQEETGVTSSGRHYGGHLNPPLFSMNMERLLWLLLIEKLKGAKNKGRSGDQGAKPVV